MTITHINRLRCSISNTPGTSGNVVVGAATSAARRTFTASEDGKSFEPTFEDGTAWETRTGCVYTHATSTLTRGTLVDSSTGSAIALTSAATVGLHSTAKAMQDLELARGMVLDASLHNSFALGAGNLTVSGVQNTAIGEMAASPLSSGSYSTYIGYRSGSIASTASYCTAIGAQSLTQANGDANSAIGSSALGNTTSGHHNTAMGFQASLNGAGASYNTAVGTQSLYSNTGCYYSTAIGYQALYSFTGTGTIGATAIGDGAGFSATTAQQFTAIGRRAGYSHTSGIDSTYIGASAGYSGLATVNSGSGITAAGSYAFGHNTTGSYNTGLGRAAGWYNTSGSQNSYLGYRCGYGNSTGQDNVSMGFYAGHNTLVYSYSTFVGSQADYYTPAATMVATATAGAGLAANTYAYRVSFVLDGLESGQIDSVGSTVAVSGGNLQVTLSVIPTYSRPKTCTARKIYRTPGYAAATSGDHLYGLVTTIADNVTTTYVDSTPDASLGSAPASKDGSIMLGFGARAYKSGQMVVGSSSARITEVYIGGDVDDTSPQAVTHISSNASGSNVAGADHRIAGGRGTGSAGGGKVILSASAPGSSGSTANALVDVVSLFPQGYVFVANATTVPSSTPSGGGYLYAEAGALKWRGSSGTITTIAAA